MEAIEIRKYRSDTDKAFVFSTWLRNYKHSSYFAKRIKPVVFFAGHHAVLDHLLSKEGVRCAIACNKDDAEQIFGYLVYEMKDMPVVHFVFVKDVFRGKGVARTLFNSAGIEMDKMRFTHWTYTVDDVIRKHPDIVYNPYEL